MYHVKEILLMLLIVRYSSAVFMIFNSLQSLQRDSLIKCIEKIGEEYFLHKKIITIMESRVILPNNEIRASLIELFMENIFTKLRNTVVMKKYTPNRSTRVNLFHNFKSHIYILHIRSAKELLLGIPFLKDLSWNPHAKFIVLSTVAFQTPLSVIEILTKVFWKFRALNIIFILPEAPNSITFNIYTWFPYSDGNCADKFDKIKTINKCTNGTFVLENKMFPEKIPKNLQQCPVKVRTVIWPPYVFPPEDKIPLSKSGINFTRGLEIVLLNNIARIANFSIVYSVSNKTLDWGALNYKGEVTGLFKPLINEEVDMGISCLAATPIRYMYLDPSIPYTSESIAWCVPKANFKPVWLSIFQTYTIYTWMLIILVYFIISYLMYYCSCKKESIIYQTRSESFLITFSILIGISVWKTPETYLIRILFLLWTIFSLHCAALYETNLIKFILHPILEKQISTMEELINNDMSVGSFYIWREYFNNNDPNNPLELRMRKKWVDCLDIDTCLSHVAYYRNYSIAIPRLYISYSWKKFLSANKEPKLYWFRNDYISYPVQLYAYRGFPFIYRINNIISAIFQSGILKKWEQDLKKLSFRNKTSKSYETDNASTLTLQHLQGAFFILSFGIICSIIIFLLEWVVFTYKKRYLKTFHI